MTGATGFVGSHLVKRFVERGNKVAILMRGASDPWRIREVLPRVEAIFGDLSSIDSVGHAIQRFAPDAIVHLAWSAANTQRYTDNPAQVFCNVPGSLDLVHLATILECKFVGMGTVLESGRYKVPHPEDIDPRPKSLYGASKHAVHILADHLCRVAGVDFAWVRLFWAYGPGDDPARMIPYLIRTLLRGEKPSLTRGEQRWDYLYIDDAVEGLIRIIDSSTEFGAFNLGSGLSPTIARVAETIRDIIDLSLPLGLGDIPYSPNQIMHLQADVSRLRSLGWEPKISLVEGLHRTVEWFRGNPQ